MALVSHNSAAGLALQSPSRRLDREPLKKGQYSVASRALALSTYFLSGALAINLSQIVGTPLYLINQDWYNAWIAFTKQSFGLLTMSLTQAFAPTKVIVSGDASVRGQLLKSTDGNLILDFPSRLILIANHQIYTDWLYLWWIAYCNGMHGRLYIILKESLKKIPVLGWGMQLSQFIFLKRNWEKDKPHMASALQRLNKIPEPMWLLLFPEGTNLAPDTRKKSAAWAQKSGITDMQHVLLPRTTGLQFCLEELKETVDYLYDCTVAYEGVPRGQFAQDIFTLKAGYLEGRPPKSVSMHWRRFAVKDIPIHNQKAFETWLIARWREKDIFIENYLRTGKFPADTGATKMKSGQIKRGSGHVEVQIQSSHWYEFLQIFAPMGVLAMVLAVFYGGIPQRFWQVFNKQALQSSTEDIKKAGLQAGTQAKVVSSSVSGLTLDDLFDKDKQEQSFKKGALAVGRFLNTQQAQTLLNRVDFMTSFLQNPEKTVANTMKGKQKSFMKAVAEEEARLLQKKLPSTGQNVGTQKGKFWEDLEALDKSRHGSVISASSSKPAGTFWAELKAAEQRKGGLDYEAKGTFWDQVKMEENSRFGTVRTISSDASTAVGSVHTLSSTSSGIRKPSTAASSVGKKASAVAPAPPEIASKPTPSRLNKQTLKKPVLNESNKRINPPPTVRPQKLASNASKDDKIKSTTALSKLPHPPPKLANPLKSAPSKAPGSLHNGTSQTVKKPAIDQKSKSTSTIESSPNKAPVITKNATKPQAALTTPKLDSSKQTGPQTKSLAKPAKQIVPAKKAPPKLSGTSPSAVKPTTGQKV